MEDSEEDYIIGEYSSAASDPIAFSGGDTDESDKGSSRAGIFDLLIKLGIPFIDVGMGLSRNGGPLNGMLRVTYYGVERARELREKGFAPLTDDPNDLYRTNIQIGELNALNACLAVVRFKQLRGFYYDELSPDHFLFGVGDLKIASDAETKQN